MACQIMSFAPPPLPLGWTEHIAPGGQPYYYNALTKESSYIRPLPDLLKVPAAPSQVPVQKKERPLTRTPIPGTDWLRIKTTEGNVFYTHKVKKVSVWSVPDEIKDAVAAMDVSESAPKAAVSMAVNEQQLLEREVERVKAEVQSMVKRKAGDQPTGEIVVTKKARVDEPKEEDDEDDGSEEEEWQRDAAAQLAAEAEEEKRRQEEAIKREEEEAEAAAKKVENAQINIPERVDLSIEEAKALFKTLLREKDVNPLHPWDLSLPLFVNDPRYILLPSVSARRDAFDEYCRDRARELRQSKVKKEKEAANPKEEFEQLLKDEVKSTRTSWTDFRRAWKRDRRFFGWGRDDKEREKQFREFLKNLGEKKRAAAQKAEADFFALLKEKVGHTVTDSSWKDVKRSLYGDPRYDAVGSSSLREELFNTYCKAQMTNTNSVAPSESANSATKDEEFVVEREQDEQKRLQEKRERAVREREQQVKVERDRIEAAVRRSKKGLNMDEGERLFNTLLVDAIRDSQATWNDSLPELKTDPRFTNSPLPVNQQMHLFQMHVNRLRARHLDALHALFEADAPSLAASFKDLNVPSLLSSQPVSRLGLGLGSLQNEFERWQRERNTQARRAFDDMMNENSFVEFWGRLKQIGGEGVDGGVAAEDMGEDEGEGGGGKVDMKALAKNVDVQEIVKVLRNDKRYTVFDHAPEQREFWIRDFLSNLAAPQLSVHTLPRS
ncbi:hypothetical protein FISHEDRAFT_65236 [Fistulina hepatica ATCC 64428]|nr:hypothetical protein FISHEDRAFT_65236 [Fistulina hepatica ATCC 64428]